jgi:methionine-rich copper-binding protein CopC
MASANSSINIAELDFDNIKRNLKDYLRGQDKFNDYDFESSVISTVLDLLAYNTHYNAYYLNMVANEAFLDTAVKRGSVISHAKLLNYTPSSAKASKATIEIKFNGTTAPNFTIPKYTKFSSQSIDGVQYPFVTLESLSVSTSNNIAQFYNVEIYQGQPVRYTYSVNNLQNESSTFTLPDANIDTTTLQVLVYDSAQSTTFTKFELASKHLTLDNTSTVYFLQEGLSGLYEIYFGDGGLSHS